MPLPLAKRMLALAEKDPLGCAFGLSKDKKDCMLLVEKAGSGKKIAAKLRAEGKDLTLDPGTVRFGKVDFDANDPGTVRFTVNRAEAGGTLITLTRFAKKCGYQAIVINIDPALDDEAEDAAVPAAEPPPPTQSAVTPNPIDPTALKARLTALVQKMIARIALEPARKDEMTGLAKNAQIMLATNNLKTATEHCDALETILNTQPPPTTPPLDAAALKARLTDLFKRMVARIAVDPASKDLLSALARDGQTLLQAGGLAGATAKADALQAALATPLGSGTGGAKPEKGEFVKMQTSRLIWEAARKKVAAEIKHYIAAIEATFEDDDEEDRVLDGLEKLDDILLHMDDALTDTLDDMLDERTSPEQYQKLLAEAKAQIGGYEAYLNANPLVQKLEGPTPFGVNLSVGSTLGKTLQTLRAALH